MTKVPVLGFVRYIVCFMGWTFSNQYCVCL